MAALRSDVDAPGTGYRTRRGGKLLVVDDDPDVREMLGRYLRSERYAVTEASTGQEALAAIAERGPDLIILDVMLASEDGFEVLTAVRRMSDVPIILLTARQSEADRILGLKLGADDYVCKPFSPAELEARVGSVLRRGSWTSVPAPLLEFGALAIDLSAREVRVAGTLIETTAREFDLLSFLASSPRQVFSREQILSHVWDSSSAWQDDGTVTEHIRRLRRKLETDPDRPCWIRTVRGVGYRFEP